MPKSYKRNSYTQTFKIMKTDINNMHCEAHESFINIETTFTKLLLPYEDATKLRNFLNKAIRKHNKKIAIKKGKNDVRNIQV